MVMSGLITAVKTILAVVVAICVDYKVGVVVGAYLVGRVDRRGRMGGMR